jgi:hypothetical protein
MIKEEIKEEIISKAGFPLYVDYWDKYFLRMSSDQVKETLKIIFHFNKTFEILETEDLAVAMVINTIIDNIKRDANRRLKQSEANRNNGKLGGRPPKKRITKPKDSKQDSKDFELPDFIDIEMWNDFVRHRKTMKADLTERSTKLIIKDLIIFENNKQGNGNLALENTIKSGKWTGVFEPKPSNHLNSNLNASNLNADDRLIKSLEIITKGSLIDKISVSSSNKAVLHFKSKKDYEELGKIEKSKRDEIKKIISESLKTNDFEFKF